MLASCFLRVLLLHFRVRAPSASFPHFPSYVFIAPFASVQRCAVHREDPLGSIDVVVETRGNYLSFTWLTPPLSPSSVAPLCGSGRSTQLEASLLNFSPVPACFCPISPHDQQAIITTLHRLGYSRPASARPPHIHCPRAQLHFLSLCEKALFASVFLCQSLSQIRCPTL